MIFLIHLNFPIRSRCALNAIIYRKKQWIALQLLEKVLFQKDAFYDIVNAYGIWLFFIFYHNLFWQFSFNVLNILKNLLFINKNLVNKKGFVVEISLGLVNILPYYFYWLHFIHHFYLTKIMSIYL